MDAGAHPLVLRTRTHSALVARSVLWPALGSMSGHSLIMARTMTILFALIVCYVFLHGCKLRKTHTAIAIAVRLRKGFLLFFLQFLKINGEIAFASVLIAVDSIPGKYDRYEK
jgi:hypothetical protein